jgi:hypothetical protein
MVRSLRTPHVASHRSPHVLTFVRANDVTLHNVTITNPGFWGVQVLFIRRQQPPSPLLPRPPPFR